MAMPKRKTLRTRHRIEDVIDVPRDNEPWMHAGACVEMPARYDLFFPETKPKEREAKSICASCPVAYECLDFSIRSREVWGIWGGMTFDERCDFTTKYRGHTSPAAVAAHRRHITELNCRKQATDADRSRRLRTSR